MLFKKTALIITAFWLLMGHTQAWAFDINHANTQLNQFENAVKDPRLKIKELEDAIEKLYSLKQDAEECIQKNEKDIKEISAQLPEEPRDGKPYSLAQQYLANKRTDANSILSQCRLLALKADDVVKEYSLRAQQRKQNEITQRNISLPHAILKEIANDDPIIKPVTNKLFNFLLGPAGVLMLSGIMVLLALSIISTPKLRNMLENLAAVGEKKPNQIILHNCIHILRHYLPTLLFWVSLNIFLTISTLYTEHYDLALSLASIGLLTTLGMCTTLYIFTPPLNNSRFTHVTNEHCEQNRKAYNHVMFIIALGFILKQTLYSIIPSHSVNIILQLLYLSLILVFFRAIYLTTYLIDYFKKRTGIAHFHQMTILFTTAVLVLSLLTGYQNFCIYVTKGMILSSFTFAITYLVYRILFQLLDHLITSKSKLSKKMFGFLMVSPKEVLFEITIFKILVFIGLWGTFLLTLNSIWSLSQLWTLKTNETVFDGFVIVDTKIIPIQFVIALLFFAVSTLVVKITRSHLYTNVNPTIDSSQEAYITIMSYVAYGFVLVLALLIGGVDIRGLALVAGALSVGIGFGLQNIVNNFVSGIVLLLERPIKKGDRINMGDKDGYVTHVGIRSTRITTVDQADVIVPNADLISNNVINLMYNNKNGRNGIQVGVKYGTDTKLVVETLKRAALKVDDVVNEGNNAPEVYFLSFGDNALIFELWYVLTNVNRKFAILSDLHHAIYDEFNKESIEIAFPQMDLHIKDWPPEGKNAL